ncbi:hypothetical protein A2533_04715 [Candidatus Falkowbacteria bacterium RIFOXYD2_FULL_35_9]|uniref:S-adenosylmethionine decarboxylase n=1 Tax=Candidatus Falkowbacteria bacterium RIFOXYC2_FULL_36_12 TaxID=1798002 RepID=A0A1F5T346_9BACT|nr:MAG: hypothetical protein A2300_04235 [Candidatus Falkowbacteria bacterium RIFOXYB2_FULL_35_7]OGF33035.1 MAG: hypothetical protein A2223_04025 [Candidatus Falkowbacteria bacterium RIFOXYA2_FULL_35_8]OGF33394.1 MAG: hypothetical protein A2478_01690 [Candidatus Falkowbacteria bacterium RIFOXYC2_FULL_36_12]OGF46075.1 MAG: hypothetical protein A2533_04715 [Candidatus Falkowbacteria bacterium RIFOXYD2_FULL_35_9]
MIKNNIWGYQLILDFRNCNKTIFKDEEKMKMKPYGQPLIKEFGKDKLKGYSVLQFIETSSITIHFDNFGNRVFIDIFSCKKFSKQSAENFCKKFFNTNDVKSYLLERY